MSFTTKLGGSRQAHAPSCTCSIRPRAGRRRHAQREWKASPELDRFADLSARLEQLDGIARWIVEDNLRAAGTRHDVAAKADARRTQALDFSREVVDDQVNTIPTAGGGLAAVGHRTPGRACWTAQQQSEIAA